MEAGCGGQVDGTTVTLAAPLNYSHHGLDSLYKGYVETRGLIGGEVAVLRSQVRGVLIALVLYLFMAARVRSTC